jgi:hypothetical protein
MGGVQSAIEVSALAQPSRADVRCRTPYYLILQLSGDLALISIISPNERGVTPAPAPERLGQEDEPAGGEAVGQPL